MFRILVFLLIVLGLGVLFAWVADNPGTVYLQWDWLATRLGRPGAEVGIPLTLMIVGIVALVFICLLVAGILRGIFGMPGFISRFFEIRRRERGYRALSRGLIAASSGDVDSARSFAKESGKLLNNEPLVALLGTQTALLEGDRVSARENFKTMLDNDETRMVALRGLFLEAERQGEGEAARHYAEEAVREAPTLGWAGTAKLRYQAADGDWEAAIQSLEANRSAGLIERSKAKRQRAVLLTAKAMSVEQADPDAARRLCREAHKLARDLVPAATTYARAAARQGDIRGASKIVEACWKQMPHPELADAYANVRMGDSVKDRLNRARKLAALKPNNLEGNFAVAVASIDATDWEAARKALEPVLTSRPTRRACLLMAEIEEGQHGDKGRMRDWFARAVRAPADEAWTADGHVSEEWLPMSPVIGEIDAFEWKVPLARLGDERVPVLTVEQLHEEAKPVVVATASTHMDGKSAEDGVSLEPVEDAELVDEADETNKTDAAPSGEDNKDIPDPVDEKEAIRKPDKIVALDTAGKAEESQEVLPDILEPSHEDEQDEEDAGKKRGSPYGNTVKFPLERRPDDPGPHPDKEPPKKGFKLF